MSRPKEAKLQSTKKKTTRLSEISETISLIFTSRIY